MLAEEFERIAQSAEREGVRLEYVLGRLGVKVAPDGDHDEIIRWIMEACLAQRPDLWLYPERGLRVEAYRNGFARPDGTLAVDGAYAGCGEWASVGPALMTVEVTSYDSDTDARDRGDKPRAYAEAGIPVYLLVDRGSCEVVVHSEPEDGAYRTVVRRAFGKPAELPEPVRMTLDTEPLKSYVR